MKLPRVPARMTPKSAFSALDRAIKEGCARREFGKTEIEKVKEFFGKKYSECVYCGNIEVERWDHLISINKGGETVLGNIVPACQPCDDSKRDEDFEKWMFGNTNNSPKSKGVVDISRRVQLIRKYMNHFGYNHKPFRERLSTTDIEQLDKLYSEIDSLKIKIQSFIKNYRKCSGLK